MKAIRTAALLDMLRSRLAGDLVEHAPLAPFTSSRIGGPARALVRVRREEDWLWLLPRLWEAEAPFWVLGGGSNVLVADEGVPGLVLHNRFQGWRWLRRGDEALLWVASGTGLTPLARYTVEQGYAGLEWAVGIPGTVGGAVVGNAGAFGGDMARVLVEVVLWHRDRGRETWPAARLGLAYRTSRLKAGEPAVVLAAVLRLHRDDPQRLRRVVARNQEHRRRTQPPGASMGSMFKNPPGDYAGRLIEAVGLKGMRIGDVEISPLHANFFINHGRGTARQVWRLMRLAQQRVAERFGVWLEPEIQLVGAWPEEERRALLTPETGRAIP